MTHDEMNEELKRGRPTKSDRLVPLHLRVPEDVKKFYMSMEYPSEHMRSALREYMEKSIL